MAPPRRSDTVLGYKWFKIKLSFVVIVLFGLGKVVAESLGYLSSNDTEFVFYLVALCLGTLVLVFRWAGKYD